MLEHKLVIEDQRKHKRNTMFVYAVQSIESTSVTIA